MKKLTVPFLNFILAFAVILILLGLFLLVALTSRVDFGFPLIPVVMIIMGAVVFYVTLISSKKHNFFFFFGSYFGLMGIYALLVDTQIIRVSSNASWPVCILICGMCLIFASFYKYKCLRGVYLFPATLIILSGFAFLAFSTGVAKVSFRHFVSKWWPFFIIACGVILLVLYLYQQLPHNKFPYEPDVLSEDIKENDGLGFGESSE